MARDESFHQYIMNDVFAGISGVTSRAMFGGWGIYKDGVIFAIIADGALYFKVDEETKENFKERGSEPFVYKAPGGIMMTMSYWQLPEEIMEEKEALEAWIQEAVGVSERSQKTKPKKKKGT